MSWIEEISASVLHLLFPHCCEGCGSDLPNRDSFLCMRCMHDLPETQYEFHPGNPVEKMFWGRLPLISASATYHFSRSSRVQKLMHSLKYRQQKDLGIQLGKLMGESLLRSERFGAEALVPLPLFPKRERKRGYNQSALLCEGISRVTGIPVWENIVCRPEATQSQTRKRRIERWKNIEGKFQLLQPERISGKHILLVDDVITTGATLESCGQELLRAGEVRLSIATLCATSR